MNQPLVAIVHYHLRRGGVTRVIEHAVEVCRRQGFKVVVVVGDAPPEGDFPAPVVVVPSLAYGDESTSPPSPDTYARELGELVCARLGEKPDLWHIHNHSLGKNLHLPTLALGLAQAGVPLVLQPHDFAEDGRPQNYRLLSRHWGDAGETLSRALYPQAGTVHYALINGRDRGFFAACGVAPDNLHLLANAVALPGDDDHPPASVDEGLLIYPTRAIRRKNLGELLLLAVLGDEGRRYAVTLAPENPAERPLYERWVALAKRLKLPVEFELGNRSSLAFSQLMKSAGGAITTSVAEGFGLAFLEPCLVDLPLVGRDLPEITADFTAVGIDFGGLYRRLPIPVDWLGEKTLKAKLTERLESLFSAYGRRPTPSELEATWAAWVDEGHVDFGRCDVVSQERVIERVASSPEARAELPVPPVDFERAREAVSGNRTIVERRFSLPAYSERLTALYQRALASPPGERAAFDGGKLLACFLAPERFSLLRG